LGFPAATVKIVKDMLHRRWTLWAGVGFVAAGIAAALIVLSVVGSNDSKSAAPTTTVAANPAAAPGPTPAVTATKAPGAAETAKLFRGIPQKLNVLGNPNAPVTMIEFADLQCPFCRDYTLNALPAIVEEYVRPGKVKLVFGGMSFLGPDSETALRATYAAGLQNRLWNFVDLLYRNQGAENSGWVTDGLLRAAGNSIPGFDTEAMMTGRGTDAVNGAIDAMAQQANQAHVNQTPTFFAGPAGGTLQGIQLGSLTADGFRPTLDSLTK
jgi:protein-disulfide isomerase